MAETLRILHYINQFYGGIGGEDKASVGLSTKDGPVGPGMLMKTVLAGRGEIVKTVICGDNYISEHQAEVIPQILDIIREVKPDLVLAGPGFNAGRYGIACAALTAAVQEQLRPLRHSLRRAHGRRAGTAQNPLRDGALLREPRHRPL